MPPPPATSVDCRPPPFSDFNFNSQNVSSSSPNYTSCSFNAGFSSSIPFPYMGRASSSSSRAKPRLVKQRKSSKPASRWAEDASVDSGLNPSRSVSSRNADSDTSNCSIPSFVFGVSSLGSKSSSSNRINDEDGASNNVADKATTFGVRDSFSENETKTDINSSAKGVAFRFGAAGIDQIRVNYFKCGEETENGPEFELSEELQKLNVEKERCDNARESNDSDLLKDVDRFFVFKTVGTSLNGNGNGERVNDGEMGANGSGVGDDNVSVFRGSGSFTKLESSSSQSCAFPAENGGARVNEDVHSSCFSFSSLDEAGNAKPEGRPSSSERKAGTSSLGLPDGSGLSFTEFEVPRFDVPFSFSSGFGRGPEFVGTRGLKNRHLRKTKGKLNLSKPSKLQTVPTPLSSDSVTQSQEAPECYSPMDFSPYEDTTSNNDVPISSYHETSQTKVTTGNPFAVYTESEVDDSSTGINAKVNGNEGVEAQFSFISEKGIRDEEKFKFTSSTSTQNHVSSGKRLQRKKYRMKTASLSGSASRVQGSSLDNTPLLSELQGADGNVSVSASKDKHEAEAGEELFSAAEKACEKWRRRGNEAYEKGELARAEGFYTWGVNSIPADDASSDAFGPLVRCYSNRAAMRMALGRVREAIQDCLMAVKLDPTFLRAQIRAANCYLQLGEVEEAMICFGKCMGVGPDGNVVCLDRKLVISASDGIQKSQKVIECTSRSTELLKCRTSEGATDALQYISEALAISINSEKLLEMKAQALCILSRHEEAITLCQKTLDFAEKNFMTATPGNHDGSSLNARQWRYCTLSKCQFHLGKLQVVLDLLEKQEFKKEAIDALAVTIHELLKHKNAGNTAFHSGKHAEAVEHYTLAILSSMESRPFAAICFCNRAAAHQALGQVADAISDCSLAIALDENYAKAVSRRATLHELIRDYKQAATDLRRLLSLLQRSSLEKSKKCGTGNGKELRQVQQRLSLMEEEAKKDTPLDLYLILGIKNSDTVSEIKKAYRKAALRHHPDKAAQSLVKSGEAGEDGRHWKDIAELVHKDSDRLFKVIGEAYAVLSDPTKREEYDDEEDMRKAVKESNSNRTNSQRYSDHYSQGFPFQRSSSRRSWHDSYNGYFRR